MAAKEVIIPDIGGATDVDVIEVLVNVGDSVAENDSLVTLESEKASMDIPAPFAGTVKEIKVNVGDKVNEGGVLVLLDTAEQAVEKEPAASSTNNKSANKASSATEQASEQAVNVPDIGGATDVEVIEVFVKAGDDVAEDDSLVTLESEKASMDIPAPFAGKIKALKINLGDKVSEGDVIVTMMTAEKADSSAPAAIVATVSAPVAKAASAPATTTTTATTSIGKDVYAGPGARRLAREKSIDLSHVTGTGHKGRITKDDLTRAPSAAAAGGALGLQVLAAPKVDFAKFGDVEVQALSKIKKISGKNLHRNWVTIPHVTQFDEADISDMEDFRQEQKGIAAANGIKLTPLVFIMKAVVAALQEHPQFNASLDASGENLIMKKYFHVGVAVDTPNGLIVPVIRDVDQKGCYQLAKELGEISVKARENALRFNDMQGGCFSISSLGGIGGTAFTPIVNMPEVAILGLSKSIIKPVYMNGEFVPRLMLPLSLSYDHRVIDGAAAARFTQCLVKNLSDIRTLLL